MKPGEDDAQAIASVLDFWRIAGARDQWFVALPAFDEAFRDRFLNLHLAVAARQHDDWLASPEGALALLILTDQFPRNAFRGSDHMYGTDTLARHYAAQALEAGHMERVEPGMRLFFCLPFEHSEDPAHQDLSVALHERLCEPAAVENDPGKGDPGKGDAGKGDAGKGDAGTSDPGTSDPVTCDPVTCDPVTCDTVTSALLSALSYARGHREIIRRFGRFPHRNLILGRTTTVEEAEFLAAGGFSG